MKSYPDSHDASQLRFAVVVSRFNQPVSARLLDGCARELAERGAAPGDIDVAWVPGAFEIPQAVRALAATGDPWLKSCAAYAIGAHGLHELKDLLDEWEKDADPLLRETVRQAQAQFRE